METKKIGLLGSGKHFRRSHLPFLNEAGAEVVAIFDPSPVSLLATRGMVKGLLTVVNSVEELVNFPGLDAVMIGSPDEEHSVHLELAVNAGKHVLCEKPLAVDQVGLAIARRALTTAYEKKLVVASCHPRRHDHPNLGYGWIAANLQALADKHGHLQRIRLVSNYPVPNDWKAKRDFLVDKVVHDVDWVRGTFGRSSFTATKIVNWPDHYEVRIVVAGARDITVDCLGMRMHHADEEFIELVTLVFRNGTCTVNITTGVVRIETKTGTKDAFNISPMNKAGFDQVSRSLNNDFVASLSGGPRTHGLFDLRVIAEAAVALSSPDGFYYYDRNK